MAWDFEFKDGDLTGGYVTGNDEIIQRVIERLERELGEWFLNTDAGLPWYQGGNGILGINTKHKDVVDQLIRQKTIDTEGVSRVSATNTTYLSSTRVYRIYMEIVLNDGTQTSITLELRHD